MKFLITGGSGFVGSRLSKKLLDIYGNQENQFIFITHDKRLGFLDFYKDKTNIKEIKIDISNFNSLKDCFRGIDYVFHCAAKLDYGDSNIERYYRVNVDGSRNIFELSLKNKVKKVVYLSTAGIFHPTGNKIVNESSEFPKTYTTKYTHSKYLAFKEATLYAERGLPIINIMPVSIFGEGSPLFLPLIKMIKNNKIIAIPKTRKKMSLLYVDDLVNGIIKLFNKEGVYGSYIFSGKALSLKEIVLKIIKISHQKVIVLEIPSIISIAFLRFLDFLAFLLKKRFYYNYEFFNFVNGGLVASHHKLKKEIDFKESDFEEKFANMVLNI